MKTACIQARARSIEEYADAFEAMEALTLAAADAGADLIIQPEMAYPAYFLGINPAACEQAFTRLDAYQKTMSAIAKRKRVHIAACSALQSGGKTYNAAVLYDDRGAEIARTYKAALWHFDSEWFSPGTAFRSFDTRFGRMGMMICADGRVPEIARLLALDGAKAIIDPVNLVASAASPDALMNQQYAFMLPIRAFENGVWILMANKCGVEAETATYLGRSLIADPSGNIVGAASPDKEEILYFDVDMDAARRPAAPRRPDLYADLAKDAADLPPPRSAASQGVSDTAPATEAYVTVAQFAAGDDAGYVEKAAHHIRTARFLGTRLLCLPPPLFPAGADALANRVRPLLWEGLIVAVPGMSNDGMDAVVLSRESEYGRFRQTHGIPPRKDDVLAVCETPTGKMGVLFGMEAHAPEAARAAMLRGCEILVWFDVAPRRLYREILQTRAVENRIFVVRATAGKDEDVSAVVSPDGAVLAATFAGATQAVSATAFLPLAWAKGVVPGTGVLTARQGPLYAALLQ